MDENCSQELFVLKISPTVISLWTELGIDETQKKMEIDKLTDEINKIYSNFIAELTARCQSIRTEIQNIRASQMRDMKAYGMSEEEIMKQISPIQSSNLIKQLEDARKEYSVFNRSISNQKNKLINLINIANDLFDSLEIPIEERGEFYELGDTDYTSARVEKIRAKNKSLQQEKEKNNLEILKIKKEIMNIVREIDDKLSPEDSEIIESKKCSVELIKKLNGLKDKYIELKVKREKDIKDAAIKINHLWELLEICEEERTKFLASHFLLGKNDLEACKQEIDKLSKLRDEKLPELISKQKNNFEILCDYLHIADESKPIFKPSSKEYCLKEEYNFYEKEIIRLNKIIVECDKIIKGIIERENIISEYQKAEMASTDKSRLMSRERGYAQQLLNEEKVRKRYFELPKFEKILYGMLIEYKNKYGTDFEWDGKPYIETLIQNQKNFTKTRLSKRKNYKTN